MIENLTCTPMVYLDDDKNGIGTSGERFFCMVCGKNYLRKRHLQRHMRDECIGIPPRFECEFCPSKFRRKYHLVRHLNSRHGDMVTKENTGIKVNSRIKIDPNAQQMCDSEDQEIASTSSTLTNENLVMSAAAMAAAAEVAANFNKDFSVDAIMMKRESNDAYVMPDMKLIEELKKKIGLVANQDLFSTLRQMNPIKF